jgi:hypothetical protein
MMNKISQPLFRILTGCILILLSLAGCNGLSFSQPTPTPTQTTTPTPTQNPTPLPIEREAEEYAVYRTILGLGEERCVHDKTLTLHIGMFLMIV